jgi:cysteine desulfurase
MGVPAQDAGEAIRVSLGWNTTDAEVDRLIAAWTTLAQRKAQAA